MGERRDVLGFVFVLGAVLLAQQRNSGVSRQLLPSAAHSYFYSCSGLLSSLLLTGVRQFIRYMRAVAAVDTKLAYKIMRY